MLINTWLWAQVGFIKEYEGNLRKSGLWTENDLFQNFAKLVLSTPESVGLGICGCDSAGPNLSENVTLPGGF